MTVAPRPLPTPQLPAHPRFKKQQLRSQRKVNKVIAIRKAKPSPSTRLGFLKLLTMGEKTSQFLAIIGVVSALGLYAVTVYTQKNWGQEYNQLRRLQNDERNFVAKNESIKEQLIQQAQQPEMGLVNPTPENNLYLPRQESAELLPQPQPTQASVVNRVPVGY